MTDRALLHRILLPRAGEPLDVRSLYTDEALTNPRRAHSLSRTSVAIGAESEVSFGTYFNAFPAGYWRRWSVLTSVLLRVELSGECRIDVYRSKADGSRIHVDGAATDGATALEFEIDLGPFEDGGWIWFDVTTYDDVRVDAAGWYATVPAPGSGRVAVGIPTFNRPADCVAALAAIASDPLVMDVVDAVIVPDQGTRKVRDRPDFDEVAAHFGDRLRIHDQANLGGSGGYSRIMYEALTTTDAEHILFMDDDIEIEPDSILRALALARFATVPTLVGGQMLNLQARSHLHVMGERIDRSRFMWGGADNVEYDHDFAEKPLRESTLLHRRIDVDYNGWWMCLIPRVVAETIGQPLPLFIKWDDAEYGLRARAAGFPTVTLPGAAIWHMAWSDKDDAIDWQAYFHLRNRLVVAALHAPESARGLVLDTLKATTKHLLCLEYSTVAIQNMAVRDFLAGPENLVDILPTALGDVHAARREYPDAVVLPSSTALPPASGADVPDVSMPVGAVAKVSRLARGLVHSLRPAKDGHHETPQLNVPTMDSRWFLLSQVDGVTVTTADGRGVVYRKRDRAVAASLGREALALRRELLRRFPEVSEQYRRAVPELTSKERWERVFSTPVG
ncbi:glycosyltransferase [Rhodococcoides corynebacterioides]|uniref:Galactofuranosyltransferase GlfT2 n=1 Tax=Rhodococcoides corynebacterioides TaxID=53972 RepID=A0ABS7P6I5_9NOCA|nr:glycosyltransferase [Rhodococcus corynebacterioides]MBY6367631.1 galactofuranosyltransferase GlfT2 [Rhodococcus corynebacterioides]MBY6408035.1 galactofuranosyltransferase GlfT2 [Rhodococcus corynebacterioides]